MTAQYLDHLGYDVDKRAGMGSAVLRQAQENGQVDLYWEYTGTSLIVFNGVEEKLDSQETYDRVKALDAEKVTEVLQYGLWQLEAIRHWDKENIEQALFGLARAMDLKIRDFLQPFFMAIAGTTSTISVLDSMALLGPDMSRARVRHAVDVLGAPGKKKLKKMEKDFQHLLTVMATAEQGEG